MHLFARSRLALAGVSLILTAACAGDPAAPVTPNASPSHSAAAVAPALAPEQHLARAFAHALADPAMRRLMRDALRASPMSEHKLVLQDFLTTPEGQALAAAAERAGGLGTGELMQLAAVLPD